MNKQSKKVIPCMLFSNKFHTKFTVIVLQTEMWLCVKFNHSLNGWRNTDDHAISMHLYRVTDLEDALKRFDVHAKQLAEDIGLIDPVEEDVSAAEVTEIQNHVATLF